MTRADRGDWDMHPSDADPKVPEAVDAAEGYSCASTRDQRPHRSLSHEDDVSAADAYETGYWKRGE